MAATVQDIAPGRMILDAEGSFSAADVQVRHLDLVECRKSMLRSDKAYRIDLCVTDRLPSRMRFDRWPVHRYERPGRLFVVPPRETLFVWNQVGRETIVTCNIYEAGWARLLEDDLTDQLEGSLDVGDHSIEKAMLALSHEVRRPGFATDLMVESLALQIVVRLQRYYRHYSLCTSKLSEARLRRIEDRLRSSDIAPSLLELADLCGLSVRHLSREFQAKVGMSLGRYVASHRIERAKALLVLEGPVKSVASRLGFTSTASFCAAFRIATGFTPSAYRVNVRAP